MVKRLKNINKAINNEEGFTLLEVLIAITILSMLMVSVYTIIDNSTTTRDTILSEDREKMQFEMGLARLERDLDFLYSPLYYEATYDADRVYFKKAYAKTGASSQRTSSYDQYDDEQASSQNIFENNSNYLGLSESNKPIPAMANEEQGSLIFLTSGGRRLIKDSKQSNLVWVRYQIVSNENAENEEAPYALTRSTIREDIYNPNMDWDKVKQHIVINNLKEFKFEFWNPKTEKYVSSLKLLNETKETPRIVLVKLTVQTPRGETYETQRSYRPLWPYFDSKAALEEKYKFKNTGATGGLTGGSSSQGEE